MRAGVARKKRRLLFIVFLFSVLVFMQQLFLYNRHIRNKVVIGENTKNSSKNIVSECFKDLKDQVIIKKLRKVLEDTRPSVFVLLKYLPNCASKPSRKFVAYFTEVLSKTLEEYQNFRLDFENPWTNRTHNNNKTNINTTDNDFCPWQSPFLQGHVDISFNDTGEISDGHKFWNWPPTLEEVALEYQNQIEFGGSYAPSSCICRGFTAFIIPFRNRDQHLRFFLHYYHNILRRQQLCYTFIVVEQDDDKTFNKGQLMNTGFKYAKNLSKDIDCFVFHDVDIVVEDDRVIYTCRDGKTIHHIAPYINKYQYKLCCGITVGAAVGFNGEQFEDLNGFSNLYAGWGGEDDDMDLRIKFKNYDIWRSQKNYTRFMMVIHGKDVGNPDNEERLKLLEDAALRLSQDGLTSLQTIITSVIRHLTHTRIKVKTFEPSNFLL